MINIEKSINEGIKILKNFNIEFPAREAGIIISHVLEKSVSYIYAHGEKLLEDSSYKKYIELINKKAKSMPTQYITGKQEFMGLKFYVNENVLIPRADTEILVESVLDYVKSKNNKNLKILEIGTGTGCISISLVYYTQNVFIHAVDISKKALEVAESNAKNIKVSDKIEFLYSDLYKNIDRNDFDIIVSNPPYIKTSDLKSLDKNVKNYEPIIALDGGNDGLEFYKKITKNAKDYLKNNGCIFFEIGINQEYLVKKILLDEMFYNINTYRDLNSIVRVINASLPTQM